MEYKLNELLDHKLLYDIEPRLKKLNVKFENLDGYNGVYRDFLPVRHISLNNNLIDKGSDAIKSTLIHEIQHYNQFRNDFETGTSTGKSLEDMVKYVNSLGEIDSTDTQQRIGMTQKELQQESPESSKDNPVHPKTNELIQKRINELANNKNDKYNKKKGRGVFEEEIFENSQKVKDKNDKFDKRNENNGIELDNSSFSVSENQEKLGQELAEGTYKKAGIEINDIIIKNAKNSDYEVSDLQFVFLWYTYARGV